ncbi:sucrose-6-phosphate hydrolase [Anaerobacillus alkalidiazotrophicus]|uniref:Sucrose-6-phosphate hydrolase n=1 Tax=Anaerobacillus alkalidiazotrophicus TaxID=472963 RepID=A0A1S2MAT4_9BACI|nr:sucrose-6-phosphate hydrolase [Anaerobacillus alkalidiazotrophicus]OIJ21841.1 sucrose-6-phosphate hydrolase [Anaerobacillus alkalidiazotrophicus]
MTNKDLQLRSQAYEEVEKYKDQVESDYHRLQYHLMAPVGLLNDPNGFIQFKGVYHLFYQWNPFNTGHGAKFWGHYASSDLVNWTHDEIALTPSDWFDKNGCYSGSAVEADGKMKLFYTGNVKDEEGNRETYQCLAESEDGFHFEKKGVVVNLPEGYTPHFRDPKVWQHEGLWYMIVGAQSMDLQGKAALLSSKDLNDWRCLGDITGSHSEQLGDFGYMWECPDLFRLEDKEVLVVSPQGLEPEGMLYNNVYQSGYFVGKLNYETAKMEHGEFIELDRGFEFYAPQTTVDEKGRRLMFAWMGVPDQDEDKQPTIEYKWVHAMTLPRELVLKGEKLYQKPPEELKQLRKNGVIHTGVEISEESISFADVNGDVVELVVEMKDHAAESFEISIRNEARLIYDFNEQTLTLERNSYAKQGTEKRQCQLSELKELRIFLDTSSIEVFVNEGEEVFTARIFPSQNDKELLFKAENGTTICTVKKWDLLK